MQRTLLREPAPRAQARVLPEPLDRSSTTFLAEPPEGYFNGIVNGMRVHLRVGTSALLVFAIGELK